MTGMLIEDIHHACPKTNFRLIRGKREGEGRQGMVLGSTLVGRSGDVWRGKK